jgi:SAM-dependent methyltransferase
VTDALSHDGNLRLLAVIASYGLKNREFLNRVIENYRRLDFVVDIIVLSETEKDLGVDIEVVVGLPAKNPWSLPFGHKKIFADKVDQYDLFAYSEDDIQFSETNIQAFLQITPILPEDELAGFQLYEKDDSGEKWLPGVHGGFHWEPESVRTRGREVVAEFSNAHSACYLLTRDQLKRAIASGGFLRGPTEGEYDMLCTAATDPYINCGFHKVIPITQLEDFLVYHLPNRYVGRLGLSLARWKEQIKTLLDVSNGLHPATNLFRFQSKLQAGKWLKGYDEILDDVVLQMVPDRSKTILSIGSGYAHAELQFQKRGLDVTTLPLDSVSGAISDRRGIEVIYGDFRKCVEQLGARTFDCVLLTNLLHLLPDPKAIVEQLAKFVAPGGTLVVAGPNFDFYKVLAKRILRIDDYGNLGNFERSGVVTCGPAMLKSYFQKEKLRLEQVRWFNAGSSTNHPSSPVGFGRFLARDWNVCARRSDRPFAAPLSIRSTQPSALSADDGTVAAVNAQHLEVKGPVRRISNPNI